jgi:hypothetical protein
MGQAALVGYATAGAFASQAYLDEYWCIIFIFDAARRLVAKQLTPARAFARSGAAPWLLPQQTANPVALAKPNNAMGYAETNL